MQEIQIDYIFRKWKNSNIFVSLKLFGKLVSQDYIRFGFSVFFQVFK